MICLSRFPEWFKWGCNRKTEPHLVSLVRSLTECTAYWKVSPSEMRDKSTTICYPFAGWLKTLFTFEIDSHFYPSFIFFHHPSIHYSYIYLMYRLFFFSLSLSPSLFLFFSLITKSDFLEYWLYLKKKIKWFLFNICELFSSKTENVLYL